MSRILSFVLSASLVASPVLAGENNNQNNSDTIQGNSTVSVTASPQSNSSASALSSSDSNSAAFSGSNASIRSDDDTVNLNANTAQGGSSKAYAGGGEGGSSSSDNSVSVSVEGDRHIRQPVSTAYAAPLTSGLDTCMGSTTAGGQGVAFGLSFGTTWTDKNCVRLKNARELSAMGYQKAAVELLCQDKSVAKAMKAAGHECVVSREPRG